MDLGMFIFVPFFSLLAKEGMNKSCGREEYTVEECAYDRMS